MEPVACLLGGVAVTRDTNLRHGRCVVYRKTKWTQTDHKFKPINVTTQLKDGRKLDWFQCRKCGYLMSENGET